MSTPSLPFENRWTSGEQARHWMLQLEREGEANVRAIYADHERQAPDAPFLIDEISIGFVRDWLAWHDQTRRRRRRNRHRVIVVLLLLVLLALAVLVWRTA